MNSPYSSRALLAALRPWRRRLSLKRGIVWSLRGLAGGICVAVVLLLVARFVPWPGVLLWAGLPVVIGLAAGSICGLAGRPALLESARQSDRLAGLADRLSTAWELRSEDTPIICLQRENALESLKGHHPADVIRLWPGLRVLAPVLAGIAVAVLLVVLPNPMDEVIQGREEFQNQLARAVEEVRKTGEDLTGTESPLNAEERAALEQALEKLEKALNSAEDAAGSLKALTEAEEDLRLIEQQSGRADALREISQALSGTTATESLGQALASLDQKALREAVNALAGQIEDLDPEALQELVSALQQAANSAASQDEAVAGALRSAARAAASGDPEQADPALEDLQEALAALQSGAASEGALERAMESLRKARSFVSGIDAAAGQGSGEGDGSGNGNGVGEGTGNGSENGSGEGSGSGSGSGQGEGDGTGTGSGGGRGGSGAGNQPGAQQGSETGRLPAGEETVYIPGTGPDIPVEIQAGSGGGAVPGALRPYREVIGDYAGRAREHMERSNIPAGYQDLVRRYFSELEE